MHTDWNTVPLTKIALAVYVEDGGGKSNHKDRPFHGLVLNDDEGKTDYIFSDGTVLHTERNCVFYLPKGSSYHVRTLEAGGGCYAINFASALSDAPFSVKLKDPERLRKSFHRAAELWKSRSELAQVAAMEAVYAAILQIRQEQSVYLPRQTQDKLQPALQMLQNDLTDPALSVEVLARACDMSQVYFRKLFKSRFGIAPKEYIIRKRLEYAKQLLLSGQFSVSQVADLCGYAEPCHFSREFTARFGIAPNKFT